MRRLTAIVLHTCGPGVAGTDHSAATIRAGHLRGWRDIGYHLVIRRDGSIETGRPIDQPGAHVEGHNADTVGICVTGDGDLEPRTPEQLTAVLWCCRVLRSLYGDLQVLGHREYPGVAKSCPGRLVDMDEVRRGI